MSYGILRKLRIIISVSFFLLTIFLLLDFANSFPAAYVRGILYLQFIPSIIRFTELISVAAAGFIVIIIITLLFGRIYCSFLCPLGTLQDIISSLKKRFTRRAKSSKPRYRYQKPLNWLRYVLLALAALIFMMGSMFMLNLLDPFSVFGKIIVNFFRPVYLGANNLLAHIFESFDSYIIYPVRITGISWVSFSFSILMLGTIIWLAARKGRLYCNSICPVGSLLGLLSKISIFRIRLDKIKCTSCGKCSAVCKAGCIHIRDRSLDFSRCVSCMNCLIPCPSGSVNFEPVWRKEGSKPEPVDMNKRRFLVGSGLLIGTTFILQKLALGQEKVLKEVIPGVIPVNRKYPVTPPGSVGRHRFNDTCTACHLCISQCPTQVLQPSYFQYGLEGMFQPRMDYITGFCNYECTVCGEICPTGAILPLALPEKKLTQLGQAKFVKENCIVYTRNTDCGACSEHCPTKAVSMVPYLGKLTIPKVTNEICVGCGACEYACPTDPKSIYVEGNPLHKKAEKPKTEENKTKVNYKEEFPF
jgi:ferredoxin